MRIVAAVGGNALLERGEPPDAEIQQRHIRIAIDTLAPLARSDQLVVTHGNGPQVGLLALESAADPALARPYPLDVLGAQTQGMIGYWLLQGFQNAVPGREIASVITQTLVSASDPAFTDPAKFVGPVYPEAEAGRIAAERGWTVKADGNAWRRVVASPIPLRIVETRLIRKLLDAGAVVICSSFSVDPGARSFSFAARQCCHKAWNWMASSFFSVSASVQNIFFMALISLATTGFLLMCLPHRTGRRHRPSWQGQSAGWRWP